MINTQLVLLRIIIVIHLGIKPVRGGKPPKDRSVKLNIIDMLKELINIWGIWEKTIDFHELSIINIGATINEYIVKYIIGTTVEPVIILPIIHPIWVIEE